MYMYHVYIFVDITCVHEKNTLFFILKSQNAVDGLDRFDPTARRPPGLERGR